MKNEVKPTESQTREMEELMASVQQGDYFAKRKELNIREGISGFLISIFIVSFFCTVLFLRGAIEKVDVKLISFCMIVSALMAVIQSRYVMGSVFWVVFLLLAMTISWFIIYGFKTLFI